MVGLSSAGEEGFLADLKEIEKLSGQSVEAGWFDEQGEHPTAEMSYPELALYHAQGRNGVVPRDVLGLAGAMYPPDKDEVVMRALGKWLDNPKGNSIDALLGIIGENSVNKIKSLFGSALLTRTSHNPDPLVATGALRDATSSYNPKETCKRKGKEILGILKEEIELLGVSNKNQEIDELTCVFEIIVLEIITGKSFISLHALSYCVEHILVFIELIVSQIDLFKLFGYRNTI